MKNSLILLLALTLCWAGCSKTSPPAADNETSTPAAHSEPATPAPAPEATPPAPAPKTETAVAKAVEPEKPPLGMKVCFECGGTGDVACNALGCQEGMLDCPGPCLKSSKGHWEHMHVEGYSDDDLWQIFTNDDGTRKAVNQGLVGRVFELQNGTWTDTGPCQVCGGTSKVKCTVCNGTGKRVCPVCDGKKFVPELWTAFNNPRQMNPPKTIHLKDGTTVFGKLEGQVGSTIYVRTEDGRQVTLNASDVASP